MRALLDDHGKHLVKAVPSQPVEILGLQGTQKPGIILPWLIMIRQRAKLQNIGPEKPARKNKLLPPVVLGTNV